MTTIRFTLCVTHRWDARKNMARDFVTRTAAALCVTALAYEGCWSEARLFLRSTGKLVKFTNLKENNN